MVYVDSDCPWQGHQYDTSVRSGHRGHRLGLLLKTAMLRWLRDEEPQLRVIDTSNAASNEHMIRVNETMGYHIVLKTIEWQRRL
jgi:RimJ/RimL family protein N-acetyltransferase